MTATGSTDVKPAAELVVGDWIVRSDRFEVVVDVRRSVSTWTGREVIETLVAIHAANPADGVWVAWDLVEPVTMWAVPA